jgi:DNA-binding transcriptional LysR family regulator
VCAVADRLSFTAAAADLGLTQPAVSRLVTGAERRLGLTLFHRAHRAVTPRADTAAVVLREQLHALLPAGHPLAGRAEVGPADLAAETVAFWSGDAQPRGRAWLTAALVAAGHDGRLFGITLSTVAATVAAGAAVTVLAPSYARVLDLGGIVLVPVTGLHLDLVVLWRRGDLSPALRHFLTVIDTGSGAATSADQATIT